MEEDGTSRFFQIEEFLHGILVSGDTVFDLNVRVALVDGNIREFTREHPYLLAAFKKHADYDLAKSTFSD